MSDKITVLLVGGPADGQRVEADRFASYYEVPLSRVSCGIHSLSYSTAVEFHTASYRIKLLAFGSRFFYVGVIGSMTEADIIEKLIEGYAPKAIQPNIL